MTPLSVLEQHYLPKRVTRNPRPHSGDKGEDECPGTSTVS